MSKRHRNQTFCRPRKPNSMQSMKVIHKTARQDQPAGRMLETNRSIRKGNLQRKQSEKPDWNILLFARHTFIFNETSENNTSGKLGSTLGKQVGKSQARYVPAANGWNQDSPGVPKPFAEQRGCGLTITNSCCQQFKIFLPRFVFVQYKEVDNYDYKGSVIGFY